MSVLIEELMLSKLIPTGYSQNTNVQKFNMGIILYRSIMKVLAYLFFIFL